MTHTFFSFAGGFKLHSGLVALGGDVISLCLRRWRRRASAAVGVTITPNVVTNDYVGKITISITGLTTGKTVRVEKFADLNTNGVLNPADVVNLWQSFTLTDGQPPVLGGRDQSEYSVGLGWRGQRADQRAVVLSGDGRDAGRLCAEISHPGDGSGWHVCADEHV